MLAPEQCRAARAWLEWTIAELAAHAHVGVSTIRSFEASERTPIQNNLDAIRRALEEEGMIFTFTPKGEPLGVAGKARGTSPRADVVEKTPKLKTRGKKKA
jgi:hypothetical protein